MGVFRSFTRLVFSAAKPMVATVAGKIVGEEIAQLTLATAGRVAAHLRDPSTNLVAALRRSHERAWYALEIALGGDSLWAWFDAKETKNVRELIGDFLVSVDFGDLSAFPADFRSRCLAELRSARTAGLLETAPSDGESPEQLAADLARYADPSGMVTTEREALAGIGARLKQEGHGQLAELLARPAGPKGNILAVAARYFFRREVVSDGQLFGEVSLEYVETLSEQQRAGFASLERGQADHAALLARMLDDCGATRRDVSEILDRIRQIQTETRLSNELRPRDSLSIRGEIERQYIKALLARLRRLPAEQRDNPKLLNDLGVLCAGMGAFPEAQPLFRDAAAIAPDNAAKASACHNAYRNALERKAFDEALPLLLESARLDARFKPFNLKKYEPRRVLGAGGFGVVFLCRNVYLRADVVVKVLQPEVLDRSPHEIFAEAMTLKELRDERIIQLQDCEFADEAETRPYLVMDYFAGDTLEQHARLPLDRFVPLARELAGALAAAHDRGVLHRDLKPANVLAQFISGEPGASATGVPPVADAPGSPGVPGHWRLKLIDFGLALKIDGAASTARDCRDKSLFAAGIVGTFDYSAPEQLGDLPGTPVGPYSDVYAFGRVCYYLLLGTPKPDDEDKDSLPAELKRLLARCTATKVERRPATIAEVLTLLPEPNARRMAANLAAVLRHSKIREWVAARVEAGWNADEWAQLLDGLRKSPLWPLDETALTRGLLDQREELRRQLQADAWRKEAAEREKADVERQAADERKKREMAEPPVQRVRRLKEEAARLHEDARALVELHDYEEAGKLLEGFRPELVPQRDQALLTDVTSKRDQLRSLHKQIHSLLDAGHLKDLRLPIWIGSYLAIKPNDAEKIDLAKDFPPPKAGSRFTNALGMEFAFIPPGTFTMGSPNGVGGDNERPQRQVTIANGFFMGVVPVTQEQWQRVMGNNPSNFKNAKHPVEQVSWLDCQEFVAKLREKDGWSYRLPSEAEWEYASRAGTTTAYFFGDGEGRLNEFAWFDGNSGKTTHPVGQKKPNSWGLLDILGNVWEWCEDYYGPYDKAPTDGRPQTVKHSDDRRVLRGGSCYYSSEYCRSAYRNHYAPVNRYIYSGLRVVFALL